MLNPRQHSFAVNYAKLDNGTDAAVAAGYSPRSAHAESCRLLKVPEIQEVITEHRDRIASAAGVTRDSVVYELANQAFVDRTQIPDGLDIQTHHDLKHLPQQLRRQIEGWSYDRNGNLNIKWVSKQKALDMLIKLLGYEQPPADGPKTISGDAGRAPVPGEIEAAYETILDNV